jgi:exosome complex RNA-binding protein Csl4
MKQLSEQQQICQQIMFGNFTNEELNGIVEALKFARASLAKSTIRSIKPGTDVQFTSSKTGKNITGEVTKVGRKFLVVREHGMSYGNWRVPANMVEVL